MKINLEQFERQRRGKDYKLYKPTRKHLLDKLRHEKKELKGNHESLERHEKGSWFYKWSLETIEWRKKGIAKIIKELKRLNDAPKVSDPHPDRLPT